MTHWINAAIALGSNLGDRLAILEGALDKLEQVPEIKVKARSPWYETAPVGPPQPDYLNGCAWLLVSLTPLELLHQLLAIEHQFGRIRRERFGPRTLDLDLLLVEDFTLDSPELQIPHPRMQDRAFVLVPLADIAADWIHPTSGKAIAALLALVDQTDVRCFDNNKVV